MIKKLSKILLTFFIVVCSWNVDVQATFEGSNQEEDTIQYLDPNIKWEEEPKVQNNTDNPVMRRRAGNIVNITEDSNVLKDNNGKNIAYAVSIGYDGHFNGKRGKFWTSNGAIAYCLEPLVKLKNGSGFTYQNLINYKKLSDVTKKELIL